MRLSDVELARRLVDVDVPRAELVRLSRGVTPAKLARVAGMLDPVELMFALKKLRARRVPGNQAHVTNLKENPALLAADAAEAAARGFAEMETTVGVARYAPLNAIALLVGSQAGRPGVMTQCAVEERRNLELAIRGLVTYAETLSVYGTESVFADGDDTPWSKAFLASAYASRGVKVRFTSGTGSEALMGHAEGFSMLYLEARCLAVIRAAGSQGVQNGSISCVALVLAVPGGTRAILAENLIAAWLDHLGSHPDMPSLVLMPFLPVHGPLAQAFDAALAARGGKATNFARHQRALLDAIVERDVVVLDAAFEQQRGRERLRQTRDVVRRVDARANRVLHVGEAETRGPDEPFILDDGGGQTGDVRLDAQSVEVALEEREGQLLLRGRTSGERDRHEHREQRDSSDTTHGLGAGNLMRSYIPV